MTSNGCYYASDICGYIGFLMRRDGLRWCILQFFCCVGITYRSRAKSNVARWIFQFSTAWRIFYRRIGRCLVRPDQVTNYWDNNSIGSRISNDKNIAVLVSFFDDVFDSSFSVTIPNTVRVFSFGWPHSNRGSDGFEGLSFEVPKCPFLRCFEYTRPFAVATAMVIFFSPAV